MSKRRLKLTAPADPGASADAVIYDPHDGADSHQVENAGNWKRCRVMFYTNVADAIFKVDWAEDGAGTLRSHTSTTVAASTLFFRDVLLFPGRTKIYITTVTDPTTWQLAAELIDDHALGQ